MTTVFDTPAEYGPATDGHVSASSSALEELCSVITSGSQSARGRPVFVRLCHYEHRGFLTPLLFGFAALSIPGDTEDLPPVPFVSERAVTAHVLRSADATRSDDPFTYAVVANHPVAVQIEHTLATLAMLLSRQDLIRDGITSNAVQDLDLRAAAVDAAALHGIKESLRTEGWRAAAAAVASRSAALGIPLSVRYERPLFSQQQLAQRTPVLRYVYNELPAVRASIDKTATMLSQGLSVVGAGRLDVSAFARDLLDVGMSRTYLAHLARDAFVCGNGYLLLGSLPDEDLRLLRPESVEIVRPGVYVERVEGHFVEHRNVLHLPGANQYGSTYGVSALEPFVQVASQREVMSTARDLAKAWDRDEVPTEARKEIVARLPMAQRQLLELDRRTEATLGGANSLHVAVPPSLYFRGMEQMQPAAESLTMRAVPSPNAGSPDASR